MLSETYDVVVIDVGARDYARLSELSEWPFPLFGDAQQISIQIAVRM